MNTSVKQRIVALGMLLVVLVGVWGCERLRRDQPTAVTVPVPVAERSDFIMGAPEISDWGAQYAAGNPYVMVNIPVAGALQVDYGIVNGGTYALFLETRQPVGLEIGLVTREVGVSAKGVVDLLEWVCVTYQVGASFASIPANGLPQAANNGAWVQYQRQEDRVYHWWPPGAGFMFSGPTQRLCVIENGSVQVSEVSGPFPRPPDTDGDGVPDASDNCPTVPNPQQVATDPNSTCRLIDNANGTVTDMDTGGKMWEQTPDNSRRSWCTAKSICESSSKAGYNDWRLASKAEWKGLTGGTCDFSCNDWLLPAGHPFSSVQNFYWTSTPTTATCPGPSGTAWNVNLNFGNANDRHQGLANYV